MVGAGPRHGSVGRSLVLRTACAARVAALADAHGTACRGAACGFGALQPCVVRGVPHVPLGDPPFDAARGVETRCGRVVEGQPALPFVSLLLGDGILPPKTAAAGFLLDGLLTLFLLLAVRLTMLVLYDLVQRRADGGGNALRTLVYGTGDKEIALAVRLQHSPHYRIAGFLTYGRQLKRYTIAERPVCYFENRASIAYLVGKRGIDAVLFSSPAAARDERERLVKYCTEAGVRVLVAPPIDEVTDGRLMKQVVREIRIEDLLAVPRSASRSTKSAKGCADGRFSSRALPARSVRSCAASWPASAWGGSCSSTMPRRRCTTSASNSRSAIPV